MKKTVIFISTIIISFIIWDFTYKEPIKKLKFTESTINDLNRTNKLLIDNNIELIQKSLEHNSHQKKTHYFSYSHLNSWLPEKSKNTGYLERLGFSPKSRITLEGHNYKIAGIYFNFEDNKARYKLYHYNNSRVNLEQNLYFNHEISELPANEHFLYVEELNEKWKYIIEYRKRKDGNTIYPTDINETLELRNRVEKN